MIGVGFLVRWGVRAGAALAATWGAGELFKRVKPPDPFDPDYYVNESTKRTMQVFNEVGDARSIEGKPLHGVDRVLASEFVRGLPASFRLDVARANPDPEVLRANLEQFQKRHVQKYAENPEDIGLDLPWHVVAHQFGRGNFLDAVGLLAEAPKRMADIKLSEVTGQTDSMGRNWLRLNGDDPDSFLGSAVSGAIDMAGVVIGDPLLVAGKLVKSAQLARSTPGMMRKVPGAVAWAKKMAGISDPGEILRWERLGGGYIADPLTRRKIARSKDPEEILDLMDDGLKVGRVVRVPSYFKAWKNRKLQPISRGPIIGKLRPVWDNAIDLSQSGVADEFLKFSDYLFGDTAQGKRWISRFAKADPKSYPRIAEQMAEEGLQARVTDITLPQIKKYAKRFGVKADNWDQLAKRVSSLPKSKLDDVVEELGLKIPPVRKLSAREKKPLEEKLTKLRASIERGIARSEHIASQLAEATGARKGHFEDLAAQQDDKVRSLQDQVKKIQAKLEVDVPNVELKATREAIRSHLSEHPKRISSEATKKLKGSGQAFFTWRERAHGRVGLEDGIRPGFETPLYEAGLARRIMVPSFEEVIEWEEQIHNLVNPAWRKKTWPATLRKLDNSQGWFRSVVLMNPRYIGKQVFEEAASLIADPIHGGAYLRDMLWGVTSMVSRRGVPGKPFFEQVKEKGWVVAFKERSLYVNERNLRGMSEKAREAATSPVGLRSTETYDRMLGIGTPIDQATIKGVEEDIAENAQDYIWKYVHKSDGPVFIEAFADFLNHQVLTDRTTKLALAAWGDEGNVRKVLTSFAKSNEGKRYLERFEHLSKLDPDKFADLRIGTLKLHLPEEFLDDAVAGAHISPQKIEKYVQENYDKLPEWIPGQVMVTNLQGVEGRKAIASFFEKSKDGFFGVAGAIVDQVGRNRGYAVAFKKYYNDFTKGAEELAKKGIKVDESEIIFNAMRRAEKDILKRVDNFSERTMWGVTHRGIIPFFDAHLRFWKRWGRTAFTNPAALERYRLLFAAGESMGWIEPDEFGSLNFTVPIVPEVFSSLMPGSKREWERWMTFTVGNDLPSPDSPADWAKNLGQVVTPRGIPYSLNLLPGVSPAISIPTDALTLNMPTVRGTVETLLGETPRFDPKKSGFAGAVIGSFMPAWANDIFKIFEDEGRDAIKGKAVIDSFNIKLFEFHEKHGRLPNSEKEVNDILGGARGWEGAKFALFTKVLARLFSPFSQSSLPYGADLAKEYHELRAQYGPEEGFERFFKKHPGGVGYAIPRNVPDEGPAINASKDGENFYLQNPDFFEQFPEVAGLFTRDLKGFDLDAYSRMRIRGKTTPVAPTNFVSEVFFRLGNREYFDVVRPEYFRRKAAGEDPDDLKLWLEGKKAEIDSYYPGWSKSFLAASGNRGLRQHALGKLEMALGHPAVKGTPGAQAIAEFMGEYQKALAEAEAEGFTTLRSRSVIHLRQRLQARAAAIYAQTGSETFQSAYEFFFRPEVELLEDDYPATPRRRSTRAVGARAPVGAR